MGNAMLTSCSAVVRLLGATAPSLATAAPHPLPHSQLPLQQSHPLQLLPARLLLLHQHLPQQLLQCLHQQLSPAQVLQAPVLWRLQHRLHLQLHPSLQLCPLPHQLHPHLLLTQHPQQLLVLLAHCVLILRQAASTAVHSRYTICMQHSSMSLNRQGKSCILTAEIRNGLMSMQMPVLSYLSVDCLDESQTQHMYGSDCLCTVRLL